MRLLKTLLQTQSLRWNFVGNVTGRVWLGVMNLVAVPIFVYLLGTEAFGIVSLVQTLQSMLAILDLGLASTVNREVAISRGPENRDYVADVAKTFELVYWTVAVAIGLGLTAVAGWIAHSWLNEQSISPADIQMAIVVGGIAIAARWPVALYTGILQGLERQVLQNAILIAAATARVVLTIAAVMFVSRTVYCFLAAQAVSNAMEVLLIGYVARRLAKVGAKGRFNLTVVRRVWRFAIGFNLVGAFGALVVGTDKLLISKLLPLTELTYYSVAWTPTGALQMIYIAAAVSLFPRLSMCWQRQDLPQMLHLCQMSQRLTVYVCLGPVVLLCFFPSEVLALWTRSSELASHACLVLPVLAVSVLINCAYSPVYNAIIAAGRTRIPLLVNAASLPAMVIGCYFAIRAYGLVGAAVCWLVFNLFCFLIYWKYFRRMVLRVKPVAPAWVFPFELLLPAGTVGLISRTFLPPHGTPLLNIYWLACTMALYYVLGLVLVKSDERRLITATVLNSR